ncbi:MAG: hypothetical protein Q7R69_01215 [bacterium]|nr:hypothetical protein [bacterium]
MKRKQLITLVISLTLVGLFLPTSPAKAQGLLPFGGVVSFEMECTCTVGFMWIWFSPLYLGGPVVITGPMVYSPYSTILYGYYEIGVSGTWHLGDYTPGVQACWMILEEECIVWPSFGLMGKVGTNQSTGG